MKNEYRIVKIIETNRIGNKKIYYIIQKRWKWLFGLIKFPWRELSYYIFNSDDINNKISIEKCTYSKYHIFNELPEVKEVLNILNVYPEIQVGLRFGIIVYIPCFGSYKKYREYFWTSKEAISFLGESDYVVYNKSVVEI